MDKNQINNLKILLNPGVITNIYSHPCCSVNDFFGVLLGKNKVLTNTKVNDQHSNLEQNFNYYIIEKIVFLYKKSYLKQEKFFYLLEKIQKTYPNYNILSIRLFNLCLFSSRSFSFPNMSLKEQDIYINSFNYMKKGKVGISILFGVFSHNITDDPNEKIKSINLNTKFFIYNESKKMLDSLPFEIINLKDTSYPCKINPLSDSKFPSNSVDMNDLAIPIKKLKGGLIDKINEIENKVQNEILDLKGKINSEFKAIEEIISKIKAFEK